MDTFVSFGDYSFDRPALGQLEPVDNFRELMPLLTRLPYTDGAFDQYGPQPAPLAPGTVRCPFWVSADTPAALQRELDALAALAGRGIQTLVKQVMGSTQRRQCRARLRNLAIEPQIIHRPHANQRIELHWDVPQPGWSLPAPLTYLVTAAADTPFNPVLTGQGIAYPRVNITVDPGSAAVSSFTLTRHDSDGNLRDRLAWQDAAPDLAPGVTLAIECGHKEAMLSTPVSGSDPTLSDAFAHIDWTSSAWLALECGTTGANNALTWSVTPDTAVIHLSLVYYARYFT